MNKNIIYEDLVEKNIDLLNLYRDEEKEKLSCIFDCLNNCLSYYKTSNNVYLNNKISNLKKNNSVLLSNRDEYCNVLKEALRIYRETAQQFVSKAESGGGIV